MSLHIPVSLEDFWLPPGPVLGRSWLFSLLRANFISRRAVSGAEVGIKKGIAHGFIYNVGATGRTPWDSWLSFMGRLSSRLLSAPFSNITRRLHLSISRLILLGVFFDNPPCHGFRNANIHFSVPTELNFFSTFFFFTLYRRDRP